MSLIKPLLNAVGRQVLNALVAPKGAELAEHRSKEARELWAQGQHENTSVVVRGDVGAGREAGILYRALAEALEVDESRRGGDFDRILEIVGMSGRKYRRLINRYVALSKAPRYLEVGSWAGSTACAAIHGNQVGITCIDDWSQFGGPRDAFFKNIEAASNPGVAFSFIESDYREVDFAALGPPFSIYLFDGPHSRQEQYDGVRLAQSALAETFLLIVDDWNWEQVRKGTLDAIADEKLRLHLSVEIRTSQDNSHPTSAMQFSDWHNGYYLCACRKDPAARRARNAPGSDR